jgi:hypothetical protein
MLDVVKISIDIVSIIVALVALFISIKELNSSKKEAKLLLQQNNYSSTTNIYQYVEPEEYEQQIVVDYKEQLSKEEPLEVVIFKMIILFLIMCIVLSLFITLQFYISSFLCLISAFFIWKTSSYVTKNKVPYMYARRLIFNSIMITVVSISSYFYHPIVKTLFSQIPNVTDIFVGQSYFINWIQESVDVVKNSVFSIKSTSDIFTSAYIIFRFFGTVSIISFIFHKSKDKNLSKAIYKYILKPKKQFIDDFFRFAHLSLLLILFHINIIYFPILIPIFNELASLINRWATN